MGLIVSPDGKRVEFKPANGSTYTLEEMQKIVDGYIEIVPSSESGKLVVLNEDGLSRGDLRINNYAVPLLRRDVLCVGLRGNALLADESEIE